MPSPTRVRIWPRGAPSSVLVLEDGRLLGIEEASGPGLPVLDPALPNGLSGQQATTAQHEFTRFLARAFGPKSSLFRSPPVFGRTLDRMIASREKGLRKLDLGCGGPDYIDDGRRSKPAASGLDILPLPPGATASGYSQLAEDGIFPFPDNEFDVVRGLFVLEHATNLPAFIREVSRVIRHGGLLAFVTTHCPGHAAPSDVGLTLGHVRDFSTIDKAGESAWIVTLRSLLQLLTAAQFAVSGVFGSRLVQPDGGLKWCLKPQESQSSDAEQLWIFARKKEAI